MLRHRREMKKEIREHNDVHLERLGTSGVILISNINTVANR